MSNGDTTDDNEQKYINIKLPRDQYDQLVETKERNGMTWKGLLLHAQRDLRKNNEDSD